ncbi:MAG: hypothetical protein HGA85_07340, partial [Nanoarchaeota archaeon]|nr:hypothetical protein [Nanoarchaeota archaeon]
MKLTDQLLANIGWAKFPGKTILKKDIECGPDVPHIMYSLFYGDFIAPVTPLEKEVYSLYSRPFNHSLDHAVRFPDTKTTVLSYLLGGMYDYDPHLTMSVTDRFKNDKGLGYVKWSRTPEMQIFDKHCPSHVVGASFGFIRQKGDCLEKVSGTVKFNGSGTATLRLDDERFQVETPEGLAAYLESRGMEVGDTEVSQIYCEGGITLEALDQRVLAESTDYRATPLKAYFDNTNTWWGDRVAPLKGTDYSIPFEDLLQRE